MHIIKYVLIQDLQIILGPPAAWVLGHRAVYWVAQRLGVQTYYGKYPKPNRAFFHPWGRP